MGVGDPLAGDEVGLEPQPALERARLRATAMDHRHPVASRDELAHVAGDEG